MGLSDRKNKQRIGDDPRNTKWAKNQSNPGFKILSSMGWSPSTSSLGASSNTSDPVRTSWKRLPGSSLPIIKSTTSGIGANPAQTCSSSYLLGAPRFVRSSQSIASLDTTLGSARSVDDDADRSSKIAIVAGSQGGGFDDLLSRLNRSKNPPPTSTSKSPPLKSIDENLPIDESFVLVSEDDAAHSAGQKTKANKTHSILKFGQSKPNKPRKRVRILELCQDSKQETKVVIDLDLIDQQPPRKKIKKTHFNQINQPAVGTPSAKASQNRSQKPIHVDPKPHPRPNPSLPAKAKKPEQKPNERQDQAAATTSSLKISRPINPRVASRAKYIHSKRLASSGNAAAMAEILGIAPPLST